MDVVIDFLLALWEMQGGIIITILALIVLDVLLGILAAIAANSFEWEKLGDFYRTKIVPMFGGYLLLVVFFEVADPSQVGEFPEGFGPAIVLVARAVIYVTLVGSILGNLRAIGIVPKAIEGAMDAVGLRNTPKEKGAPGT